MPRGFSFRGGIKMKRIGRLRFAALLATLGILVAATTFQAGASERLEFGVGLPISTSFSFSSFSVGLEGYARLLLGALAWEPALGTPMSFGGLYVRNTIATTSTFFLALGHVTNLLPHFGSTYFTFGAGMTFGGSLVARIAANLALSVGGGLHPFLELRFQLGLDP
jgi:hypothetical protein